MKWFGKAPFAPACDHRQQVAAPVGVPCAHCEEGIKAGDDGFVLPFLGPPDITSPGTFRAEEVPFHQECMLRTIIGSCGHQLGQCECNHVEDNTEIGITKREAARRAAEQYRRINFRWFPYPLE